MICVIVEVSIYMGRVEERWIHLMVEVEGRVQYLKKYLLSPS